MNYKQSLECNCNFLVPSNINKFGAAKGPNITKENQGSEGGSNLANSPEIICVYEHKFKSGFAKGVSRTVSPRFCFSENETEENGKKTEENGKKGENRNPKKNSKKRKTMETEKRKKTEKTEENGKKRNRHRSVPFAKSRNWGFYEFILLRDGPYFFKENAL